MITIDGAQGREKDFVILSCVRSNTNKSIGFLQEYKRINVALTRAKHGLIIVADLDTLRTDKNWDALLNKLGSQVCDGFHGAKEWIENKILE